MRRLAEICIERPVFASMLILTLVVAGAASWLRLGVDRFPPVDLPTVSVRTVVPGAAIEEVETQVTLKIEEAVNTAAGIDQLRSVSTAGSSFVIATFELDRDIDVAAQDVRDRVAAALRDLPRDIDPPIVSKFDNDQTALLSLALSGDLPQRELSEIADKIVKPRIERASGVGEVRLVGALERAINVWLDGDRLYAYGLAVGDVRDAIAAENAEVPGGNVTGPTLEQPLRTLGRLRDPGAFDELVVAVVDGVPVRVRDLGRADDGSVERRSSAWLDGNPAVSLEIRRVSNANSVAVIDGVKARLAEVERELPAGVQLDVVRDQSRYIRAALGEIELHLVLGSFLACGVVLLFMRSWRATLIAAVAIPTSVIATFSAMEALGFTLNSVTMLALVLMVGIVIDDAIVVLENVFRFAEEKGLEPFEAARQGTAEIAPAVLATTLSLAVIFVPVSFMDSISGRFLRQFGLTAAAALMVSLLVSFTLTPMMSARLLVRGSGAGDGQRARSRGGFYSWIERGYLALLRGALRFRFAVVALVAVVLWWSVPLYRETRQEYIPSDIDEAEFEVNVNGPQGLSVAAMEPVIREVDARIRALPGVRTTLADVGGGFIGGVNQGSIFVRIAPHGERVLSPWRLARGLAAGDPGAALRGNYSQRDVMTAVRTLLRDFPELRCSVRNAPSFNIGGGNFEIDFALLGPDLQELGRYAEQLRATVLERGGVLDLDTTLKLDKPELHGAIDRDRAAALDLEVADLAQALRLMVGGDERVSRFYDPGVNDTYDVRLRLLAGERSDAEDVRHLFVPARDGTLVRLDQAVALESVNAPSRVDRLDRQRQVSLRGAVAPGYGLSDRLESMQTAAAELRMPTGYTTRVFGKGRELEKTHREFVWAFLLSLVFMYIVLAAQFESLVHPLTILMAVPLSFPFALWSLNQAGATLNLYSALGMLVLFGVVKKNAILQIDHTNQLRARGLDRARAILDANRDRLRPILMTTFTLVMGMLPLLLGTGPGAEERHAIAVVVIGGQTLSLLLTLIVTPVVYSLFDDLAQSLRRAPAR